MLTPKQIRIFEAFLKKPFKEFTFKEIKEYSNEKSNSIIQNALAKFYSECLVKKREVANIVLYAVDLSNSTVFAYFEVLIKEKSTSLMQYSVKIIRQELLNIEFVSIVIFGSYAEGKQTEKSDLDIAIFVNSLKDKKSCEMAMKSAELKSMLPLDIHVITKGEMLQMLKDKHENLGKQIAYRHLAIHNPMVFYSILEEGINNGFKIVYS